MPIGFAREDLMARCEENGVDYVFGLARNERLVAQIARELEAAEREAKERDAAARCFKDFRWATLESWSRKRRVIAKAEWTKGEADPRFIVTSLARAEARADPLRGHYCERGTRRTHQGMPRRSVRRPHAGSDDARQPVPPMVRLHGLRPDVRAAPPCPCWYRAGA